MFTDESIFHVSGEVEKHIIPVWGTGFPHGTFDMSRIMGKVTDWSELSVNEAIGLCYFDDADLDKESFLRLLPQKFQPVLSTHYK